jgi:hypothetical protein
MSNILSQSSWWILNKALTKIVGIDAALLLADLISKQEYFYARGELGKDGSFFNTRENIMKDTTLTFYRQNTALRILQDKGFLTFANKGVPPKTRFILNLEYISKIISEAHENDFFKY